MSTADRRAVEAERLLSDPTLADAFDAVRRYAHNEFENSKSHEWERREDAHRILEVLQIVIGHLHSHIATGKIAEAKGSPGGLFHLLK